MARRRSAWRTRLIADGVRAPVQPRGVLAKFEDLYSAIADRQAAETGLIGATVDGIRVTRMRADALAEHVDTRRKARTASTRAWSAPASAAAADRASASLSAAAAATTTGRRSD